MAFEVCEPREADCGRIAEIHLAAMKPNPLLHAQFPTEESLHHLQAHLEKHYTSQLRNPGARLLVARQLSSSQVAAFAIWGLPTHKDGDNNNKQKLEDEVKYSQGCCREYLETYSDHAGKAKENVMGSEDCYHLEFVCTDPQFQRQGAGRALTKAAVDDAKVDKLPVYLESTVEGVALYEALGFREVGRFEFQIPKVGSTKPTEKYEEVCMVLRL